MHLSPALVLPYMLLCVGVLQLRQTKVAKYVSLFDRLSLGLTNGVLLRTVLDQVTGDLSDTRTRYIGSRPVKLFRVTMQGGEAVLAMSSRTWITYYYQNR